MNDRLTKLKSQGLCVAVHALLKEQIESYSCHMTESDEKEDRISELPIHLKEAILGCLSITDAIRTSVLSREWRYIWTGLRKLVVNWMFWEPFKRPMPMHKVKALDQILLAHNGPIREFFLDVDFIDCTLDARFWLLSLSKKRVENVEITGFRCRHLSIPSSIFECGELKRLSLSHCGLGPPSEFRGFHNLVNLYLDHVRIESQFLRNLIRQCPLLETLTIGHEQTRHEEIPIILNSHGLKTLKLVNVYLGNVSLENVPNLTNVSLWGMSGYDRRDLQNRLKAWEYMSSLIGIKELSFQFSLLEISDSDIIPKKLPKLLGNLKTVNLHSIDASSVYQMAFMFCNLRSSPNLQNLNIAMRYMYKYNTFDKDCLRAAIAYLEVEAKDEIKTSITTVCVTFEKLDGLWDSEHIEAEIALIESTVSCCPALGKLVIKGSSSSVKGYAKQKLSRALRRLGRSSSKPKIVYANAY